ncbi:MAG: ribonuclease HII [Bacteroidia bacterium]|nr:ribonuclease HII [Bacteroidia bacterium]
MKLLDFMRANIIEAGCDEAGRGCLAGPVFAAAVIIPNGVIIEGLNDSKQLSEKKRDLLRIEIESKCYWSVASLSPLEIDKINILNASIRSMQLALDGLNQPIQHIIIDGNTFKPYQEIPYTTVIKGDGKYKSIAAASILAKTHRDAYMEKLAKEFPEYQWERNKGYPTKAHRDAIKQFGSNLHHRQTFTLLPAEQISLF